MNIPVKKNSVLKQAVMEEPHACGIITAKSKRSPAGIDIGGYPALLASIILNGDASPAQSWKNLAQGELWCNDFPIPFNAR